MQKGGGVRFNCFSPPVMLVTLSVEFVMAIYTIVRYRMSPLTRLVTITVVALGIFQLCEYHVCTGFGLSAEDWSRFGYVAITALPPLGLHLLHNLAGRPKRKLVAASYASMAGFIVYFLTYHAAFIGYQCTGNYVIFQIGMRPALLYGLYYYGWLFTSMGLALHWASGLQKQGKLALNKLNTVRALFIGYLVFLVPTALANSVKPSTRRGIPSIMCGFAVLFALILTGYILPRAAEARSSLKVSKT